MLAASVAMNDRPRFALRFISGKYQGGEFPLRMNREIIIGRSSDLDMVLVEDMVSRRHAKISSTDAEVYIQDMGSTNGTFVNGEKQVMNEIQESTEGLLMEGVRQLDEFHNLQKQLPPLGSPLAVPTPLAGKLRELTPSELDTFQLVLDHGQLQKVLDNFPGTDLDAAQNIISLMKREFVVVP